MRRISLPPRLVEQAASFASGEQTPAEPRDAATVLLLRDAAGDGDAGPEAYLLRRQSSMAFAAGMYVFPGGGVDPRDFEPPGWSGPSPQQWATALGTDPEHASALVCAAVRETFEESGVLLAGSAAGAVVADTTGEDWEADRLALEAHDLAFSDFLRRRHLVVRSDLLGAWSAWTTPVFEPRRYRTWFFVAALPQGQRTRDVSTESDAVAWQPLEAVLAAGDAGEIGLMPPTYVNLLDAAQHDTVADVLDAAHERRVEMFMPDLVETDGEPALTIPASMLDLVERR
ncbi:NUDIX hydrolase [Nocardioides mangrovicus]|uniref:NUDIX hydrolase n=1 Tax=Nocardioides mangrovicus TaxID=2478913 RepID=A0A3L8NYG1_9ACTN|nr:NUDIX hydrolase [Nocardioides mangrovicus]RLV48256.1 NUDIX hydrolase [Nocardioides mangrovicus]